MAPRKRNAVLAAVELARRTSGRPNITQLAAFLYVCENEGLNIAQLADLLDATSPTASRTADALEAPPPTGPGWIRSRPGTGQGHSRTLELTSEGRAARQRMDELIRRAQPILVTDPANP